MIKCNVQGGLANIMFQIAAMKSLAKDHNSDVSFPNFRSQLDILNADTRHNPKLNYAHEYADVFKNLKMRQDTDHGGAMVSVPFKYMDITFEDGSNYTGFFQCEKFFAHNREFIIDIYEPNDKIKKHITEKYSGLLEMETCAIHVRRGDYLILQNVHHVLGLDYYKKGMESLGKVDKYLVFSDDMEWCRSNFKGEDFIFIEGEKDYVDLFLMSMCKHQIISNSSFSWWGAWLNKNPNKKVVGPSKWFNEPSIDSSDIIPNSWIKI